MADEQPDQSEKTEEPTSKRLDDAHKKGDVPKSQEVSTWFMLLAATLMIALASPNLATTMAERLRSFLASPHDMATDWGHIRLVFIDLGGGLLLLLLVPLGLLMAGGLAGNLVQHRIVLSGEPIKPKLSKISPLAGFKRLFSSQSLMNFAKGLAKLTIVSAAMFVIMWPERDRLDVMVRSDISVLLGSVQWLALKLMVGVVAVMTVIAGIDLIYQRHKWHEKQKMTMKELRDEHKQMEGDPTVKAKLRQVRIERGRKRMMANVPRASVVVTNPTHYAVALDYQPGMAAPVCIAKGIDALALKIREIAEENQVPLVENPPLARALYASVEIDDEIPPEHYKAVAQVIGYVMQIRGKMRR